jgi:hypothetical protein
MQSRSGITTPDYRSLDLGGWLQFGELPMRIMYGQVFVAKSFAKNSLSDRDAQKQMEHDTHSVTCIRIRLEIAKTRPDQDDRFRRDPRHDDMV